jgi:hypothetical protein
MVEHAAIPRGGRGIDPVESIDPGDRTAGYYNDCAVIIGLLRAQAQDQPITLSSVIGRSRTRLPVAW